jgi:hypothetical protein
MLITSRPVLQLIMTFSLITFQPARRLFVIFKMISRIVFSKLMSLSLSLNSPGPAWVYLPQYHNFVTVLSIVQYCSIYFCACTVFNFMSVLYLFFCLDYIQCVYFCACTVFNFMSVLYLFLCLYYIQCVYFCGCTVFIFVPLQYCRDNERKLKSSIYFSSTGITLSKSSDCNQIWIWPAHSYGTCSLNLTLISKQKLESGNWFSFSQMKYCPAFSGKR